MPAAYRRGKLGRVEDPRRRMPETALGFHFALAFANSSPSCVVLRARIAGVCSGSLAGVAGAQHFNAAFSAPPVLPATRFIASSRLTELITSAVVALFIHRGECWQHAVSSSIKFGNLFQFIRRRPAVCALTSPAAASRLPAHGVQNTTLLLLDVGFRFGAIKLRQRRGPVRQYRQP